MVLGIDLQIGGQPSDKFLLIPNALYILPDRNLAEVSAGPVWCRACNDVAEGESWEPPSEIEKELTETLQRGFYPASGPFIVSSDIESWDQLIQGMQHQLVWARERKSPAKCLRCGSVEIEPLKDGSLLPNGAGVIELSHVFASTGIDFTLYLYTSEGELLGEMSRIAPDQNFFDCRCPWDVLEQCMPAELREKVSRYLAAPGD